MLQVYIYILYYMYIIFHDDIYIWHEPLTCCEAWGTCSPPLWHTVRWSVHVRILLSGGEPYGSLDARLRMFFHRRSGYVGIGYEHWYSRHASWPCLFLSGMILLVLFWVCLETASHNPCGWIFGHYRINLGCDTWAVPYSTPSTILWYFFLTAVSNVF